jgi:transcriptional regulator with XRE-family HTH domain
MDKLSTTGPVYEYLERYGFDLKRFAEASGVYYTTLSKVLNGERKIPAALKAYWADQGIIPAVIREWEKAHSDLMAERQRRKAERRAA